MCGIPGGDRRQFSISHLVAGDLRGVMSGIAALLTRKTNAPAVPVRRPQRESIVLLIYLAVYAFVAFGPGLRAVKNALPPGPTRELVVVGYKLVVHLVLPAHPHHRGGRMAARYCGRGLRRPVFCWSLPSSAWR
jgi:hypothetical protein